MEIHRNLENWKVSRPIVTMGIFDGVHQGHRKILQRVIDLAEEYGGEPVVLTFWPHPRMVLGGEGTALTFLNTIEEKSMLMDSFGIRHLVILPFDRKLAEFTACDFIREYLVDRMGIKGLVVGFNHHFGKDREGNYDTIRECGREYEFAVERVDEERIEGQIVSSSMIRDALDIGDLVLANRMLGYSYFLEGTVVGGSRIGREIGFPTANIQVSSPLKSIPADGVYAVRVSLDGKNLKGMLNIGTRPTVNTQRENRSIEVHIFDFNRTIYGELITLHFVSRIRDEMQFGDVGELKDQLAEDRKVALNMLRDET